MSCGSQKITPKFQSRLFVTKETGLERHIQFMQTIFMLVIVLKLFYCIYNTNLGLI